MKPEYLIIYIIAVNLEGIYLNIRDKIAAKNGRSRVPEAKLWTIGLLGGALGSYITMQLIRHKTKHKSFMIGMPILIILNIAIFILIYKIFL